MPDTPQASSQPSDQRAASTPAQTQSSSVHLVVDAEDSTPFRLNPAYISLGLPPHVFKKEVGGDAT
jgi:hypothetical protein